MKKWLLARIKTKEEARAALKVKGKNATNLDEIRSAEEQIEALDVEIAEFRTQLDALPAEPQEPAAEPEQRGAEQKPEGELRTVGGSSFDPRQAYSAVNDSRQEERAAAKEAAEKRGKDLMEKRAVTVASAGIILPKHQATDIKPTFNETSSLIDRVYTKPLMGGESFEQPYLVGYGIGDYKGENEAYATSEPTFAKAQMSKAKVTSYAEDSEELLRLPAIDYDAEVMAGVKIASRKKITREILIGDGTTNHLVGIFNSNATAIDAATDLGISVIDNNTMDNIVFSYGGDEDVEDAAVLILNKVDLKAFSQLRTTDGKKFHTIVTNGNTGTIDGVPFIINSACKAISASTTTVGQYGMAYGSLSNYMLAVFSDLEVKRSEDFKFSTGMIAHRASIFVAGNVVAKNGFLRVKKEVD